MTIENFAWQNYLGGGGGGGSCSLCHPPGFYAHGISILAFDAATFVWITQSILLFSDIFYQLFPSDLDGVISQNGKTLA